jgi:hypothetical protein
MSEINRDAYEKLVDKNLAWLESVPRTLERDHVIAIVRNSPDMYYGNKEKIAALTAQLAAESKRAESMSEELQELRGMVHTCPDCGQSCKGCECYDKKLAAAEARAKGLQAALGDVAYAVVVARNRFSELNGQVTEEVWNGNCPAVTRLQRAMDVLDKAALLSAGEEAKDGDVS